MAYKRFEELNHGISPERRAEVRREALEEFDRIGYAALRKARELTQVELAERLGITQASVAGIEKRTDLQLSTLAKYIRALGGELEFRAVFPEATFNLEPSLVPPPAATAISPSTERQALRRPSGVILSQGARYRRNSERT